MFLDYLRVKKNFTASDQYGFNADKDPEIYFKADPDPGCLLIQVEF
jgi:hypothetical protein